MTTFFKSLPTKYLVFFWPHSAQYSLRIQTGPLDNPETSPAFWYVSPFFPSRALELYV
jgi:hypothetical protein